MNIGGQDVSFLIDSGATCNIISLKIIESLKSRDAIKQIN